MTRPAGLLDLAAGFGLAGAAAILHVGSRTDGTDYAGSDIDLLAIFAPAGGAPQPVTHPGAARLTTGVSDNWIAQLGADEINVEVVGEETVGRLARLLSDPVGPARTVALQPYEARLLHRVRTGHVLTGESYVDDLRMQLPLDRLPMAFFVTNYVIAASNLAHAEIRMRHGDGPGVVPVLAAVGHALAACAGALHDVVVPAMKKDGPVLRKLAAEHPDLPVTLDDVVSTITGTADAPRLAQVRAALERLRLAAADRADRDGGAWREAVTALAGW